MLIANVGVLVGLIVVVIELNQSTRVAEVSAYQDLINQVNNMNELRATNKELAALDIKARQGAELTDLEYSQFLSYWRLQIRHGDLAFLQFENGFISEMQLYGILGPVRTHLVSDIGKELWRSGRDILSPRYTDFVEQMMREREPESTYWKQFVE